MSTFGDRLRDLRKEKSLTQEQLANIFFLNKSSISRYEKNQQMPENDMLQKIADYFEVTLDYLLGRSDFKSSTPQFENQIKESKLDYLTSKDIKDIKIVLEEMREKLLSTEGLMFDGEPATPEAIHSILDAMEVGMGIAKKKNKQKYTPKRYKKDK